LIGAPGIYVASGVIRGVLVGVSPLDPLTLAAVSAGLGLVALTACYVPARRVLGSTPRDHYARSRPDSAQIHNKRRSVSGWLTSMRLVATRRCTAGTD